MPGMPFHLEKGYALMALEDLLNDPSLAPTRARLFEGLRTGVGLGAVFRDLLSTAPTLSRYGNHPMVASAGGLGSFVTGAWFGQSGGPGTPPPPYWIDYTGDIDGVVRETLLFAMEVALDADRSRPLPTKVATARPIELWWHCGQRWFEAWLSWQSADGPVRVLFATPPHTGGVVRESVAGAERDGLAVATSPSQVDRSRAMVLVSQQRHRPSPMFGSLIASSPMGQIRLPAVGRAYRGSGAVGTWTPTAAAGGIDPWFGWS